MREEDLRVDIFRAGVYEVRITHLPTGHVATSTHASLLVAKADALAELARKVGEAPSFGDGVTDATAAIQAAIDKASAPVEPRRDSGRQTIVTVRLPPTIHVVDGRPKGDLGLACWRRGRLKASAPARSEGQVPTGRLAMLAVGHPDQSRPDRAEGGWARTLSALARYFQQPVRREHPPPSHCGGCSSSQLNCGSG